MTRPPLILAVSAVLMTACAAKEMDQDDPSVVQAPEAQAADQKDAAQGLPGPSGLAPCPAQDFQKYVGKPLGDVTYPDDLRPRILRPGDIVTMEYIGTRMNIRLDEAGSVISVTCG
ncbi:MAG: I78 family peptidase inhibitor [Pseudomonadota bacterium]